MSDTKKSRSGEGERRCHAKSKSEEGASLSSASATSSGSLHYLLSLPEGVEVRFIDNLGTDALFNLRCAHRSLNSFYAGPNVRYYLENVTETRLRALLASLSFEPKPKLESLHFDKVMDWDGERLALEFSYALHQGRFSGLQVLDLSQTTMEKFELDQIIGNLRHASIKSLHFPILNESLANIRNLPERLVFLTDLEEIGQKHGGANRAFHLAMDCAAHSAEFAARIKRLDFIRAWGEVPSLNKFGGREDGFAITASLLNQHSEVLLSGRFSQLQVLKLEGAAEGPEALNTFVGHFLGLAWQRGVFQQLREFTLYLPKAQETGVIKPLAEGWKAALPAFTANLEVLKLQGLFTRFQGGVDLATAFTPDRFQALKVLDLCDDLVADIFLMKLSEAIAAGFAPQLQELECSLGSKVRRSQQSTMSAEGLRDLGAAFHTRKERFGYPPLLRKLRLGGQYIGDEGVRELADAWSAGSYPDLEDLDLRENAITDEGIGWLVESGLVGHPTSRLGRLTLERNSIKGERFRDVSTPTLTRLNISRNDLSSNGVKALAQGLGGGLKELRLGNEHAGGAAAAEIDECMQTLFSHQGCSVFSYFSDLRRLDVRRGQMSMDMAEYLIERMEAGELPKLCQLEMQVRGTEKDVKYVEKAIRTHRPRMDVLVVCKWVARW